MIAIRYTTFAIISIFVNLAFQYFSFKIQTRFEPLVIAMLVGTLAGLVTKYLLDKKFIFNHVLVDGRDQAKNFVLYSLMGVFTSVIFWGTEITFSILFQDPNAKYLGAFIGLSIGYLIKYFLDKKYVFVLREDYIA